MFNSIVVKQRSYRDQWFRICANLSVGKVMVCFHGVPFGRVLDGVGRILDCFLNLSSTIHVRKLSWPEKCNYGGNETLPVLVLRYPCRCLTVSCPPSFFIVDERHRYSELRCLQQLFRRIVSQKGRFSWLDLRIIHHLPMQVSACLVDACGGIVVTAWCML